MVSVTFPKLMWQGNHGLKVLVPEKNIWFAGYSFKRYKLVRRNRYKDRGRPHHVFDVALSRSKLSGSGLVREKASTSDEYSSPEIQYSRTNGTPPGPLPQNRVPSVGYRLFDKSGLVRECSISATAYASDVPAFSRTNGTPPGPLPQNPVSSVGYRLFDKRRLAGDGVKSVNAGLPEKTHRRQAASHSWRPLRSLQNEGFPHQAGRDLPQSRTGREAAYAMASCRVLNEASRSLGVHTVQGPRLTLIS